MCLARAAAEAQLDIDDAPCIQSFILHPGIDYDILRMLTQPDEHCRVQSISTNKFNRMGF